MFQLPAKQPEHSRRQRGSICSRARCGSLLSRCPGGAPLAWKCPPATSPGPPSWAQLSCTVLCPLERPKLGSGTPRSCWEQRWPCSSPAGHLLTPPAASPPAPSRIQHLLQSCSHPAAAALGCFCRDQGHKTTQGSGSRELGSPASQPGPCPAARIVLCRNKCWMRLERASISSGSRAQEQLKMSQRRFQIPCEPRALFLPLPQAKAVKIRHYE